MEFAWFILIGLVAGALAGWIMQGGGGSLTNLASRSRC